MTWMQARDGRPVELLDPCPEEVDFARMAQALAHLNRYTGQSMLPVSVAQHLLIGATLAPPALMPWWLLHDGHEERLGDTATPAKEAMAALAGELFGLKALGIVNGTRAELEARHDRAIHAAARLPLPSPEQRGAIRTLDLRALATERRDFLSTSRRPWADVCEAATPAPKVFRWQPADRCADQLHALFRQWLPVFAASRTGAGAPREVRR